MATRKRERRQGLEPFLAGSVAVHAALAVGLAWLLVPTAPSATRPGPTEKAGVVPTAEPPPGPATERGREEVRAALPKLAREEVAREQLRPTFEKLTANTMPPDELRSLWEDVVGELTPDLDGLAALLLGVDFDLATFNARAAKVREKLPDALERQVRRAEDRVRDEALRRQAETIAQAVADRLRRALIEQVGRPAGDVLNQALQADGRDGQAMLRRAALELAAGQAEAAAGRLQGRHPELAATIRSAAKAGAALEKLAEAAGVQALREQVAHAARLTRQAKNEATTRAAEAAVRAAVAALDAARRDDALRDVLAGLDKLRQADRGAAADRLDAAAARLRQDQEKLGVTPADATAGLLARLDDVRRGDLADAAEAKVQPLLDEKVRQALAQRPGAQDEVARQVAEAVRRLGPGKVVADAAGERLPATGDTRPEATEHARAEADKAKSAALAQLERQLGPALDAAVNVVEKAGAEGGPPGAADLLARLAGLRNAANRAVPFELIDGDAGAALRARLHLVQDGHGLGRLLEDGAAYERMREFLRDRERIVGDVVGRQGADGPVIAATERDLRPAFVGTAVPPSIPPVGPARPRTVGDPAFKTHRFAGVPLLADGVVALDGDLADWKDVPALALVPVLKGNRDKVKSQPEKQLAYAAWCRDGLLLAFAVEDTTAGVESPGNLNQFWLYDAVEIFLDTLNTKSPGRGEPHTHQFCVFPFGVPGKPELTGYEVFVRGDAADLVALDRLSIRRAAKKTPRGWTLEVLLTADRLKKADLAPGRVVGFNLQIDTGSDLYYYWAANEKFRTSMHPDTWGDLQLLGSDAKVAFLDDAGKAGAELVVPGKALRVRVEDPDMNLNPLKKDRVGVVVRAASGESRALVLEETTPTSGVFEGSYATALNVGGGPAAVLPVYEGEAVTAEYLDQVRAYGERNETVTAMVPVATFGTRFER